MRPVSPPAGAALKPVGLAGFGAPVTVAVSEPDDRPPPATLSDARTSNFQVPVLLRPVTVWVVVVASLPEIDIQPL